MVEIDKDFIHVDEERAEMFKRRKKLYNVLWSIDPDSTMKDIIKKAGAKCCIDNIYPFVSDFRIFSFRCTRCKQIFEFSRSKWSIVD